MSTTFDNSNHDNRIEKQTNVCPECGGKLLHDCKRGETWCEDCYIIVEQSDLYISQQGGDGSLDSGETFRDTRQFNSTYVAQSRCSTTFYSHDVDDNQSKYDQLWKVQHGFVKDDSGRRTEQDKQHVVEAFADTLCLSDYLRTEVRRIIARLSCRAFNPIGGLEAVALGVIAFVENREIKTEEEFKNRIQVRQFDEESDTPRFKELAEEHNVDWRSAISQVKKQLND